jgi:SAM-dependent methyltransferase
MGNPPLLVLVSGPPGARKSTLAVALSAHLELPLLRIVQARPGQDRLEMRGRSGTERSLPVRRPMVTSCAGTLPALTTLTRIGRQAVAAHDAQFDLPPEDLARLSVDLATRLCEHQPVLDAGCGSGLMLVPLRDAGLKVVGVDIDVDMIGAALSRDPRLRGQLAFADLAALAVRRSGFGSVHAAYVFHLFDDARPVLDELLRVSRPGGRLVVNFGPGRQPPPDGIDVAALTQYFTAQLGGDGSTSPPSAPQASGGPPRRIDDFAHFLASRGAVRLEDLEVVSTVGRSINYFINRLEANPFSAPSGVSPALLRSAASKTRAWAEARFGDPDAPHPARRLTKYMCWETTAKEKALLRR